MSKNLKDTVSEAGQSLANSASKLGSEIVEGTQRAARSVSDMVTGEGQDRGVEGIKDHMQVMASCGKCVGTVDHLESNALKLTRKDSPDGQHHYVPLSWIDHVDSHVHLNKNSVETELNWKPSAEACQ